MPLIQLAIFTDLLKKKMGGGGDGELGIWGFGEMGSWGDGEMGRWGKNENTELPP